MMQVPLAHYPGCPSLRRMVPKKLTKISAASSGAKIRLIAVNLLSRKFHDSEHESACLYDTVRTSGCDFRQIHSRATIRDSRAYYGFDARFINQYLIHGLNVDHEKAKAN